MPKYPYGKTELISRFQRKLDDIERTWPMTGSYERVDPYIVPYMQGGDYFELLIYHIESKIWFDSASWDSVANAMITKRLIGEGDIAFDLGCNAGVFSVVMARLAGPDGHVHAFDPYPWNAVATKCNARLNYFQNVSSYPVGIAKRDSTIRVNPNESRTYEHHAADNAQQLKIKAISNYMHLRPKFIKIDIEGAEYDLFDEQDPKTFETVEGMALELHPFFIRPRGLDPRTTLQAIEKLGFSLHHHDLANPAYVSEDYADNHQLFWCTKRAA